MKKALFGEDTQEQRELKIQHLDEQINITEMELKQINEEYQYVPSHISVLAHLCLKYTNGLLSIRRPSSSSSTLLNLNISEAWWPILIKFYV